MRSWMVALWMGLLLPAPSASAQQGEEQAPGEPAAVERVESVAKEAAAAPSEIKLRGEDLLTREALQVALDHLGIVRDRLVAQRALEAQPLPGKRGKKDEQQRAAQVAQRLAHLDEVLQELDASRDALHLALSELGRLEQNAALRRWMEDSGVLLGPTAAEAAAAERLGPPTPVPLGEEKLLALSARIEQAPFNDGKLRLLRDGLEQDLLLVAQAGRLLELFSFSRDRVDALVFMHPRLLDSEEFGQLLARLKFESDRDAVRERLGLKGS